MKKFVPFVCLFLCGCTAQQLRDFTEATAQAAQEAGNSVVDAVISVATSPNPVTIAGLAAALATFAYVVVKKYVKK